MKAHTVEVVTSRGTSHMTLESFRAYTKIAGWKVTGYKYGKTFKLKEEIEGRPIFDKAVGPMYGGEGVIRYELPDVAMVLSK